MIVKDEQPGVEVANVKAAPSRSLLASKPVQPENMGHEETHQSIAGC